MATTRPTVGTTSKANSSAATKIRYTARVVTKARREREKEKQLFVGTNL